MFGPDFAAGDRTLTLAWSTLRRPLLIRPTLFGPSHRCGNKHPRPIEFARTIHLSMKAEHTWRGGRSYRHALTLSKGISSFARVFDRYAGRSMTRLRAT